MRQENEHNSIAVAPYFCMPAPQMDILHRSAVGKAAHVDCGTHLWSNSTHVPHFPQYVDFWHGVLFVDYQWVMMFTLFLVRSLHYI